MSKVIAIGALGGSGTRAVFEVFVTAGVYMGDDLNKPNDNLIFTRLFKNPHWYDTSSRSAKEKRLKIFQKYMENRILSFSDMAELFRAAKQNPLYQSKNNFYFRALLKNFKWQTKNNIWGWKEPNTHIFLDDIGSFFPTLKYIHVIRNGLDMAFSTNKSQLQNWGYKYNITLHGKETENEMAVKQLDFWIQSTKDVIEKSKKLKHRFYMLNHNKFYEYPEEQIGNLLAFTELELSNKQLNELYKIPKKPGTTDRYKNYSLDIFREDQLNFVLQMGFTI